MSLIYLENQNFDELIKDKTLVDFYAPWCGPCKMLEPIFEKVASETTVNFVKVNIDKHGELARRYGVMSVPTTILFENGQIINKNIGFISEKDLKEFIK